MSRSFHWSLSLGCLVIVTLFSAPAWEVLSTTVLPGEVRAAWPVGSARRALNAFAAGDAATTSLAANQDKSGSALPWSDASGEATLAEAESPR